MARRNNGGVMDGFHYLEQQAKLRWQKDGGKICTIAGTAGLVGVGFHASRKTYKIHDELVENGKRISEAKKRRADDKGLSRFLRVAKETAICSAKTSRHYIGDAVIGAASVMMNRNGYVLEHRNYQKAAAMVGILAADFMNYRQNVVDDLGIEADRKYLTTRKEKRKVLEAELEDEMKVIGDGNDRTSESLTVQLDPNMLRIWYSKETTPMVWSSSHAIRIGILNNIKNDLDNMLMYGGQHFSVNDFRREFYGKKGDVGAGGLFGRVWDPGDPEHPERGRLVNLHWEEDELFRDGLTDSCWIIIDIDPIPLIESLDIKNDRNPLKKFTEVEG